MQTLLESLGQVSAVIGAQWGDEGKGKVVDLLAEHFDVVGRACGGANAGHTIVISGKKHVFHLLPSGCMHQGKTVVLGAGMVIHLPTLLEEIDTLKASGIDITDNLYISPSAHIVMNYHREIDALLEKERQDSRGQGIGTTKRGIGPAYMDKAARTGLRMEILRWSIDELKQELELQRDHLQRRYEFTMDTAQELADLERARTLFQKRLFLNIPEVLHTFLESGKRLLIEGAQATLLDIDHGTYPYVTSSSTTAAGALQGLGLAPRVLQSAIGVAKAYCTRVGSGAFPTEAEPETAERLRERGGEYGATTGRPRRCGWLYVPDLEYAALLNGFTAWNITKLDVLDAEETILVGTGYDGSGAVVYQELPGWRTPTLGVKKFSDLPQNAQRYIEFIESATKVPVALIGTGPDREHMIVRS